jgi:hypothetical protein
MGYRTVMDVPNIGSYGRALTWMTQTKPIRGRSPEVIPLGKRRDVDTYHIRKNGEDIECVLYRTPVITFKFNGDVVVFTAGWNTASTNQFIGRVLGIHAQQVKNTCVLTIGDRKYPLGDKHKLTLRANVATTWEVMDAQVLKGYVLNRAKANIVRAKYKPFFNYFKAMLKIRKETITNKWTYSLFEGVRISAPEFAEHFKSFEGRDEVFNFEDYVHLNRKGMNSHEENVERFMELVQSEDTSDFHKAFICVAVNALNLWGTLHIDSDGLKVRTDVMERTADNIILMLHAKEVLDEVDLKIGKLPNRKYVGWV